MMAISVIPHGSIPGWRFHEIIPAPSRSDHPGPSPTGRSRCPSAATPRDTAGRPKPPGVARPMAPNNQPEDVEVMTVVRIEVKDDPRGHDPRGPGRDQLLDCRVSGPSPDLPRVP